MNQVITPYRSLLRWHGGKWLLAPWIISHFPPHRIYVEPYAGGASVLLQKHRCYSEIINDLDNELNNLFNVLRNQGARLRQLLELTPFSRKEFELSYQPSNYPLEQARRTVVRSFMGFGSDANNKITGFKASAKQTTTTPAKYWANYPKALEAIINRLKGVVIENRHATEVISAQDTEQTLFYMDPPYVHETRSGRAFYKHEMTEQDHAALAEQLQSVKGHVVLSGYRCELYEDLYNGWLRIDKNTHADGARDRVESIWLNFEPPQQQLFATS